LLGDNRPALGLDLKGGISIVLFPVKGSDLSTLDTATQIISSRVDGLGISEPDVNRQGNQIVIDLPGVKDRQQAENLVGETAELRFREVQSVLPWSSSSTPSTSTPPTTNGVKGASTTAPKGASTTSPTTAPQTTTTKKGLRSAHINAKPIAAVRPAADAT